MRGVKTRVTKGRSDIGDRVWVATKGRGSLWYKVDGVLWTPLSTSIRARVGNRVKFEIVMRSRVRL